jgi:prepilin-type N-terminal cleavage/methylation domain-containing protein
MQLLNHLMSRRTAGKQRGFTMVELAIVLVVAGLILVAALKGTDMINKAKVERTVADLKGLQSMVLEYQKRTGRLPGDCNNDGKIGFTPFATVYSTSPATAGWVLDDTEANRILPTTALDHATTKTANCATSAATSEPNINALWNDMRRNSIVDPQRLPVELAKNASGSFYNVGNMTDAPGNNANVIVVYSIPIWMAEAIDTSIDGVVSYTGTALQTTTAAANTGRVRRWDTNGGAAFVPLAAGYLNGFAKNATETRDTLIAISFQFDVNKLPETPVVDPA